MDIVKSIEAVGCTSGKTSQPVVITVCVCFQSHVVGQCRVSCIYFLSSHKIDLLFCESLDFFQSVFLLHASRVCRVPPPTTKCYFDFCTAISGLRAAQLNYTACMNFPSKSFTGKVHPIRRIVRSFELNTITRNNCSIFSWPNIFVKVDK